MPNIFEYIGYSFWEYKNWNAEINGFTFTINVYDKTVPNSEKEYLFQEKTLISTFAIIIKYGRNFNQLKVEKEIQEITISKAKCRLNLSLYSQGEDYTQEITTETLNKRVKPLEDSYIQEFLLRGLKNLRKKHPDKYKYLEIKPKGFCEILKIKIADYLFNADLLVEENLIGKAEDNFNAIEKGLIFITTQGIKFLNEKDKQEELKRISSKSSKVENDNETEKYDIAISFAGEDRGIASQIADSLRQKRIKVFYDSFEESTLWGKNLYDYLNEVYGEKSKYCLMLLSQNYKSKLWTNHERESAQARAFRENREYILPIKIDDTKIPGINETVGYLDINTHSIERIVELIIDKLNQ